MSDCIFCKIVNRELPAYIVFENENILAFMDKFPLSNGHVLVIPKRHAAKLHDADDEALSEILPIAKRISKVMDLTDYNILQNNGTIAHQQVHHVHFHIIPKSAQQGLTIDWKPDPTISDTSIQDFAAKIKERLG